jgi:hypothetical protein
MLSEISWKSEDVFALLDAISSGTTLSHERWSSDMQLENSPATKWCVDCEDALCVSCAKAHKGSKTSMGHHVIDIDAISTFPGEVLTTQEKCSRHPDFIMDFFCNQHHVICCRSCMGEFSSILVHGLQLVFEDIPKVINRSTFERYVNGRLNFQ